MTDTPLIACTQSAIAAARTELSVVPSDGGHFPHREYPERFLSELESFLAE